MAMRNTADAKAVRIAYREHRGGDDVLSVRVYLLAMALFILAGIGVSVLGVRASAYLPYNWITIGVCVVVILGSSWFADFGRTWTTNAINFAIVAFAFGLLLGPIVDVFLIVAREAVMTATVYTAAITVGFGLMGLIWPRSLEHWLGLLVVGLITLIVVDSSTILLTLFGAKPLVNQALVDWLAIALFAGIIAVDMNMAIRMRPTLSNAVFNAMNMYLNMANIWVRILSRAGSTIVEVAPTALESAGSAVAFVADVA